MASKLNFERSETAEGIVIIFSGLIDEDADFQRLSIHSGQTDKKLIFDFSHVTLLNSCGIREWISFTDKLSNSIPITYRNCPQIIIEQMNMVHGFIKPGAKIESFYAPYYCVKCDREAKILLKTTDVIKGQAPQCFCEHCQQEMEFDAIENQYFNFLK